jgi:hypothetical protein
MSSTGVIAILPNEVWDLHSGDPKPFPFARDLTGDFCTSGSERGFTLKERWYANEEIQAGADCDAAAAD